MGVCVDRLDRASLRAEASVMTEKDVEAAPPDYDPSEFYIEVIP